MRTHEAHWGWHAEQHAQLLDQLAIMTHNQTQLHPYRLLPSKLLKDIITRTYVDVK